MERPPMWEKQKEALAFLKKRSRQGKGNCLFMEMGTGKTRVAIHWLEWLIRKKGARLILVAAPLAVLHVWIDNWFDWADEPIPFIDLHDASSGGIKAAKRLARKHNRPVICLVNYEAAWQIGFKRFKKKRKDEEVWVREKVETSIADVHWDVVILDESTAIKTPGSTVSKFFRKKVAPKTTHRMVMTGSAYIKRPLDVWAQVTFATGNEVFTPTFTPFRSNYAIPHPMIPGAVLGYRNLEDLAWRLSQVAVLLKKSDVLDLPPATHQTRMVQLSPKSRKLYTTLVEEQYAEIEALEKDWEVYRKAKKEFAELDEEQLAEVDMPERPQYVTAQHIFTCINKQMQITSGFIYPDRDEEDPSIDPDPVTVGKEKVDEVIKLLEQRDSPTVIVCHFDQEEVMLVEAIRKKFGFVPKVLNGSVKTSEARHKMIAAAANDPAFIVKSSIGSKGVDMRWADMIIFFSHNYNTEHYDQMLCRNHRGGQTKTVTYVHLITKGTIDEKVMASLQRDINIAANIERSWRSLFAA